LYKINKIIIQWSDTSTNSGCNVGTHTSFYKKTLINLNKAIKGFQKANKIKDIMLINSYFTHCNRFIQNKQNLETCKAHIYRPHNDINIAS